MDFRVCFPEWCKAIEDLQGKETEREAKLNDLTSKVEDLSTRLAAVENVELKSLHDSLVQKQTSFDGMDERVKTIEVLGLDDVKKALEDIKDTKLPEVQKQSEAVEPRITEQDRKITEAKETVGELKRSTEKFADELKSMQREWKWATTSVEGTEKRLREVESKCEEVRDLQARLDENVEGKYSRLWNDVVVNGLAEVKMNSIAELKKDIAKKNEASNTRAASLVNYSLQVMSKAAEVAKRTAVKKEFVDLWREKADDRLRFKLGCRALDNFWNRRWRGRDSFRHWKDRASEESKILRLAKEYEAKIPDSDRIVGILEDTGLPDKVQELLGRVRELGDTKANQKNVLELLQKSSEAVDLRFQRVTKIEGTLGSQGEDIQRLAVGLKDLDASTKGLDQQVRSDSQEIWRIDSGLSEFAKANEVSGMMKDVLLIWNSIKQLDAAKADKTEMDAIALEGLNKDKQASRRLEDIEADGQAKLSEGVMMMHERWQDLHGRVDGNSKQLQTLQQMLGPLASFVEELVAKIAETQGVDTMRLPPGGVGRQPPAREAFQKNGFSPAPDGAAGGGGAGMVAVENMEQWLSGAKGIVEATLGSTNLSAAGPTGSASAGGRYSQYPPRPGSARAAPPRPPPDPQGPPTMVTGQRLNNGPGMDGTLPSRHAAGHWAVGQRSGGSAIRRSASLQGRGR